MILLSFVDFKRASKQDCIYKLISNNKILSSLTTKTCHKCTFLNHFRESNKQQLSFNKIDFVVIPSNLAATLCWFTFVSYAIMCTL